MKGMIHETKLRLAVTKKKMCMHRALFNLMMQERCIYVCIYVFRYVNGGAI